MKRNRIAFIVIFSSLILAGCSSTRGLKPGQILYTGAEVEINPDSAKKIDDQKSVRDALEERTRPRPNKSILGFRHKLFFYNLAGEPKKNKGFRYWMRTKLGEPPVLLSEVKLRYNNDVLTSYLISQGYLQSVVTGDTVVDDKKGKAIYTAVTGTRYKINSISFPEDTSNLAGVINSNKGNSLLKAGDYYDLETFKNERMRIDNDLKEAGYFYFSPDHLIMQVDSTIGKSMVDIRVRVKDVAPNAAQKPYTIRNINIFPNYSIRRDSMLRRLEPMKFEDFNIYDNRNTFKPWVFNRLVFFEKGERYNRRDHSQSLNRLVNIGTFQGVQAEFLPIDSFKNNQLDLNLYLTPLKKNSLSFSVLGTSKSNNFVGSEVRLTQTTRNVFRAAEQLDVSVSGGFETQVSGQARGLNSYSFTAEGKLTFPRLLIPFFKFSSTNAFVPKTIVSASYQLLSRGSLYNLNSIRGEFGYNFKESKYKEHTFNPISINYVQPSQENQDKLDSLYRIGLRGVLEKQFIIGSNYNFTYTNQMEEQRKNNMFFSGDIETAGNVVGLLVNKDDQGRKNLLNTPLTQFIRFEADFRDYLKLTKGIVWANRINLGYGLAYGNSRALPYVRQFFAGGSNDIRSFRARGLGPGTYQVPDTIFADQGGDIKMMLNTELRFKLISVLHGALFADAGNIWLRKEDPERPGSEFRPGYALSEMAVGTGAGLRVDATIFVIRLDVAFPIRKPYLPPGERWVIDQVDFGSKDWRRENLIYNIGIGYPF